jgi:hypothetical protein
MKLLQSQRALVFSNHQSPITWLFEFNPVNNDCQYLKTSSNKSGSDWI